MKVFILKTKDGHILSVCKDWGIAQVRIEILNQQGIITDHVDDYQVLETGKEFFEEKGTRFLND